MVVMVPNGGGNFQVVGLVEVLCKTVLVNLNRRLGVDVTLNNVLHWLRSGRGKGNSFLEAKMLQHLTSMS